MGHLQLVSLGMPEVRHAGQLLKFRTRKALALLIYLVVEGNMHSREKIITFFWPESDEPQGRAILRTTINYLRNALSETSESSHLIVERDALGFDHSSDCDLDLRTLEAAFALASTSIKAQDHHDDQDRLRFSRLTTLKQAVQHYRGSFLEGFLLDDAPDFDDWMRLQREVWHRRMSTIFDWLSRMQWDEGELPGAIDTTMRWIGHDPLHEKAYRHLMQLHLAVGDRKAALQAYETCRARLAEQVGAKPAPETELLAERIRAEGGISTVGKSLVPIRSELSDRPDGSYREAHFSSFVDGEKSGRTPMGGKSRLNHAATLPEVPLIGRANEYVKLIEVYQATHGHQAQVVILQGEAGIGKTRLASEFLVWAAAQGTDILQGRAFETGSGLPYQPLVESLRGRVEEENAPDNLLSDTWLAELARLLPELRDRYPDLPLPTTDETTAHIRLFEAVARLGQALAERAPVVLFIDDMQWADAASLDMLHYLGRRWIESNTSILLLLSLRTEALATTPSLDKWLSSLEHDLRLTKLLLNSLSFEDTMQLVQVLEAGDEATEIKRQPASNLAEFSQWLFDETRGQPFYTIETLKALLERGLLTLHSHTDGCWSLDVQATMDAINHAGHDQSAPTHSLLPPIVRDVIRARLSRLSPPAFALLAAGAVLDHDFTFERLCQVANMGEHDGLLALDEVLKGHLLVEDTPSNREVTGEERRSSPGAYYFTHDKIREVAYTEAGDARRRIFHHRALDVLHAATSTDKEHPYAAELARHALAAGLAEQAFHYSVAAGDDAMRLFAVRDATVHYEQARQVLTEQGSQKNIRYLRARISAPAMQHLYLQLGHAYELRSEFEQAQSVYQAMLAFAQESDFRTMECAALNRMGMLVGQVYFDLDRSEALLHQALQMAERGGDNGDVVWLAETKCNLAQLHIHRLDPPAALLYGEPALALARQLGQQELTARCLNVITYAKMEAGRWEEAEAHAEEARALYAVVGKRAMEVDCLCQLATAHINTGQAQKAITAAQLAQRISTEIQQGWGQANSALQLAQGSLEIGAYTEALVLAEQGVTKAQTHSIIMMFGLNMTVLGEVQRAMLALDVARVTHLEIMAILELFGVKPLIEMMAIELCADCALAGAWEEAYKYALKALSVRTDVFLLSTKLPSWYMVEALVRAGDVERATENVLRFGEQIGNNRRYRIPYLRALAVLAQYRGEIDVAIRHMKEAEKLAEEIGLPGELWSILAAQGELYLKLDDGESARYTFGQATTIVQRLADTIGNDEQKANFLAAPLVQGVLEQRSFER